ncbi:MAG: hypothetical protein E7G31_01720 [Bacteroides sp.]|nr:hypothetical protein [Bacteroides sp.]
MKRETFTSIVFLSTPGYLHISSEEGFIVEVRTFTSRRLLDILNVAPRMNRGSGEIIPHEN